MVPVFRKACSSAFSNILILVWMRRFIQYPKVSAICYGAGVSKYERAPGLLGILISHTTCTHTNRKSWPTSRPHERGLNLGAPEDARGHKTGPLGLGITGPRGYEYVAKLGK